MSKPEWGVKRTCLSCGARFYDLQRNPIICPKCGAEFEPAQLSKPRRAKAEKAAPAASEGDNASLIEDESVEAPVEGDDALAHAAEDEEDDTGTPVPKKTSEADDDTIGDFSSSSLLGNEEDLDEGDEEDDSK